MANVRVYDLSKELNVPNKVVIDVAKRIGISINSHASAVSQEEARRIRAKLQESESNGKTSEEARPVKEEVKVFRFESGEEVVETRKGRNVIIRKKKKTVQESEVREGQVKEEMKAETPPATQGIEAGEEDKLGKPKEGEIPASALHDHTPASEGASFAEHEADRVKIQEEIEDDESISEISLG